MTPHELSIGSILFAPFIVTFVFGFVGAMGIASLLNRLRLSRWFWNPGLAFIAMWVLVSCILGLTVFPV